MKKRICIYIESVIHDTFKEICIREGESISEKLQTFMTRYTAVHSLGNPQTMLNSFTSPTTRTCFRCEGRFLVLNKVEFLSGLEAGVCSECLRGYEDRGLVKKRLGALK